MASSKQRPARTVAPPAWARAHSSAISRVLPIPGSPPTSTSRRPPRRARPRAEPVTEPVARREDPFVLEPGEQLAVAQGERLVDAPRVEQRVDFARVDP